MASVDEIIKKIDHRLETLDLSPRVEHVGKIEEVRDGVVIASGLSRVSMNELVEFENGETGLVLNLDEDFVSILALGEGASLKNGQTVKAKDQTLSINVSEDFIGRVINPLGMPLDGNAKPRGKKNMALEKIAPSVIARKSVDTPLKTGLTAIDAMIPIGRGQRELIIGDRGTGKTAIAIDTIINQGGNIGKTSKPVICVYVAIGQKRANIATLIARLKQTNTMNHTIIVVASSSENAALQYLAPFAGCAIGEYFMENGRDVLLVYDDLTKHAWAYRQLSLVLRRPSGREAYPGDIFYLHSRLLERAAKLNDKYGGGSLTALPIIETQAADISSYIPTNVISITDGQIFLETDLFNAGVRPAVNLGLSVSRVGGAAQTKVMKQVAGPLRLDLAQYRELAAFAQFGSDLDKATQDKLNRGARLVEIVKQPQYSPLPESSQVLILWAVTKGFLDDVPVEKCQEFVKSYLSFMEKEHKKIVDRIEEKSVIDDKLTKDLTDAASKFKKRFIT